jgi:uncharacterized membrane protein YhaH (DUF805 family)
MQTSGADPAPQGFTFLFRQDQGTIGRATWWRWTLVLALVLGVLSGIWQLLSPYANRTVAAGDHLFDPMVFFAYAYLLVFAFAVMLIGICHYNLSAKRWRDRGRIGGLAGLLPLSILLTAAAHWLQPRVPESMPLWTVTACDVILLACLVWNVIELGTLDRPAEPT